LFENLEMLLKGYTYAGLLLLMGIQPRGQRTYLCMFLFQSRERNDSNVLDAYYYIATLQKEVEDLSSELLEDASLAHIHDEGIEARSLPMVRPAYFSHCELLHLSSHVKIGSIPRVSLNYHSLCHTLEACLISDSFDQTFPD